MLTTALPARSPGSRNCGQAGNRPVEKGGEPLRYAPLPRPALRRLLPLMRGGGAVLDEISESLPELKIVAGCGAYIQAQGVLRCGGR